MAPSDLPMIRTTIAILLLPMLCLPEAVGGSVVEETVDVEWVLVPAVVRKGSTYVRGLEAEDFELTVEGRPVSIGSFEVGNDAPVSLIHLQDLSGSMALDGRLEASRRLLDCLLARARPGDEFALASFAGGRVYLEVPFTADVSVLDAATQSWQGYGTTGLHDAVAWLPDVAVQDHSVRRAAVLITDGFDNASKLSPSAARDLVRRARLPVYVLGLETGSPFELAPGGRKLYRHSDVLNLLAHFTGGRYFPIASQERDAEEACAAIDGELRSQYVLGFAVGGQPQDAYHSIRVTVPGRKVEVRHRLGYSGRLPQKSAQDPERRRSQ